MTGIADVRLIVGMEVHVELSTRSKMFSRAPSPVLAAHDPAPNTLVDPVVLGLPGALPVMNRHAVELAMLVGLALGCAIPRTTRWDRKSYFYPDLPKAYQLSQYDQPLCGPGHIDVAMLDEQGQLVLTKEGTPDLAPIRITRAHLEEDAGKLLHDDDGSLADWNRAGTPLLEIVTEPDFDSAARAVSFARQLQTLVRFLGASPAVMQQGHMRFEPNINCELTLTSGQRVKTPIVEVKNLNSFKSLRAAIEFELREQPERFLADGRVMGPGQKVTRGWDDVALRTFVQREKEDAHDYRYFPDPDLPPVTIDEAWLGSIRARLPELPLARQQRYTGTFGLAVKEAAALVATPGLNQLYEATIASLQSAGIEHARAGKLAANLILQQALKIANERSTAEAPVAPEDLGLTAEHLAQIGQLREAGSIAASAIEPIMLGLIESPASTAESIARSKSLVVVRDDAAIDRACDAAIAENAQAAADVRAGKHAAIGRLVGAAVKHATQATGQAADAKTIREALLKKLAP